MKHLAPQNVFLITYSFSLLLTLDDKHSTTSSSLECRNPRLSTGFVDGCIVSLSDGVAAE